MLSSVKRTFAPLSARFATLPGNVRGAFWMLLASVGFTGMAVSIKLAGQTMPVFELVVLRAVFALVVISPAIFRAERGFFKSSRPGAHVVRSLFGICGVTTMMLALTHLDLALATTLSFTRTLFMIVLAVLFLNEVIRWRRTGATLIGFAGVVICIAPGGAGFDPWTLVGVLAAVFAAGVTTMIKRLTSTEPPLRILVWSYVIMTLIALGPALWTWRTPGLLELGYIALMGVFSAWGQSCMVTALKAGEVTAVAPFEYSRLVFAAAIGFFIFAEVPTGAAWFGTALIVGSTLYIAVREARLKRPH
ncbi:MAG: DMT family transporter [Pseudomonadota bacterium]